MLIVVIILLVIVGAGYAYLYNNGMSGRYANTEPKEGQIKVACVGDSITYGHGVKGWHFNNYPAQLQSILGDEYHVANFGSSGACINGNGDQPYINRPIYNESLEYDADILVIMLGTNDSKPENWTDAATFIEEYRELINTYITTEKTPQIFIGLCSEAYFLEKTQTGIAEFDIQPAVVDEIVEVIREYAESAEIEVVDVHSLTELHPEWYEKDGIHPNNDGAKAIAECVAEKIKKNS